MAIPFVSDSHLNTDADCILYTHSQLGQGCASIRTPTVDGRLRVKYGNSTHGLREMASGGGENRLKSYKNKGQDVEEGRRRREEEGVQLRKAKREEQVRSHKLTNSYRSFIRKLLVYIMSLPNSKRSS